MIKEVREANKAKAMWIGLTDIDVEGTWKFQPSNEVIDFNESLVHFSEGQPDNFEGGEHCAHIWAGNDNMDINDLPCSKNDWDVYGLCEIEAAHCKP